MRKIRDVLRLSAASMSKRKIAASLGVSATAAGGCIRRARRGGLGWPLPEGLTDEALERRLYPPPAVGAGARRSRPDWVAVRRELRRPGVTLQPLWEEHRAAYPDGYGYSRFCELDRAWEARLSPTMRQSHVARRAPVRGLRRHDARGGRPIDRRGGDGATVRRRAWRVELHLCGGHVDAGAVRLDRIAPAHLCVHRWRRSEQLATGRWIAEHRGLLVTGQCGVGKSWLSCALAQKACRDGYTVHYACVPRLFADLDLAHGDGRFAAVPDAGQSRSPHPR